MKLKSILIVLLFSTQLFASHDHIISTYIPVTGPQTDILDKDGIILHKVPFYTYYSDPESSIHSITWSYTLNSPHKRYQGIEGNLAHIKGLDVSFIYGENDSCLVTMDSSKIVTNHASSELTKILDYVEKATKLNMKDSKLNCEFKRIERLQQSINLNTPKILSMAEKSFEVFKKYESTIPQARFIEEGFYPLGHSMDGKMAYIIEFDTGASGIVHIETYIQDLITDKIVWKDIFRTGENVENINFKTFWEDNHKKIEGKLNEYKIYPFKEFAFKTGSISYANEMFTLSSNVTKYYAKNWDLNLLDTSTIYIHSKQRGKKIIDKKSYKHSSYLLERKAIGFFSLGKENRRVAVVVATVNRGWEGPPHVIGYEIVGASLSVGFKR